MRILRDPLLWLLALFIALLIGLPYSEPLFHTLFPEQPRPLYQQAGFLALTLAHGKLVVISSLAAIVIGVGAGVLVTRPAGTSFVRWWKRWRRWGKPFRRWRCWRWRCR